MNQRYIDFISTPKKSPTPVAKPAAKPVAPVVSTSSVHVVTSRVIVKRPAAAPVTKPVAKPAAPVAKPTVPVMKPVAKPVAKPDPVTPVPEPLEPAAKTFDKKVEPFYGVIEDYQPNFVAAKVEKRPLSTPRPSNPAPAKPAAAPVNPAITAENDTLAAAKAKKIRSPLFKKAQKAEEPKQPATPVKAPEPIETLKTPQTPFIKSAQVEKRPLSKNVYKKPAATPVVADSGPVTIIDKPEKDAHIGPIIAIVLTIILGAAVGTVAFLLLPKK